MICANWMERSRAMPYRGGTSRTIDPESMYGRFPIPPDALSSSIVARSLSIAGDVTQLVMNMALRMQALPDAPAADTVIELSNLIGAREAVRRKAG
jgi:hypothetical protein